MNTFAEYVRSSAFRMELSTNMIDALLVLYNTGKTIPHRNLQPYESLARRGLVEFVGTDLRRHDRSIRITPAGLLQVLELKLAGYDETDPMTDERVSAITHLISLALYPTTEAAA